jgi:glycosyltransferase involved in cell wall biosynthesis
VPKVLIVSHPAVLAVNQLPYAQLLELGWDVSLVVPARWRHEYSEGEFECERLPELGDRVEGITVFNLGSVQRHLYRCRAGSVLRRSAPDVLFAEEEPTSLPAWQWGRAASARGVPFALQMDENLDRPYHPGAKAVRRWTLANAAFIAARSPAAARLARAWGATCELPVVPHAVPAWDAVPNPEPHDEFTVGFAGRLIEEKGIRDLVEAVRGLSGARLRLIGNGALAAELGELELPGVPVEVVTDVKHEEMPAAYGSIDVLVLPSRTTPTWAEQFGRVLVEAMWCGVPVVGSSSGEIPWVIESTGGGLVFPEGDAGALRAALARLRDEPRLRAQLAAAGRAAGEERFGVEAAARDLDQALRATLADRRAVARVR